MYNNHVLINKNPVCIPGSHEQAFVCSELSIGDYTMRQGKKKSRICVGCGIQINATHFNNPIEKTRCMSCATKGKYGARNSNWKGGQKMEEGYMFLFRPDHPKSRKSGYAKRANLVWEEATGHFPDWSKREVLHHIDGDKENDAIENLRLMDNREHVSLHHYKHGKYAKRKDKKHNR